MRHAKAQPASDTDHTRDLASSGRRDAHAAGVWLSASGVVPDAGLVSSATRTRATWGEVTTGGGFECPVETSDALYAAEPTSALDLIRATPEEMNTLLVIGHNPTMGFLAQVLDDGQGDTAAADAMMAGFPTCALAVFEVTGPWRELEVGGARLVRFHVARADD